jgi:SRSO17 transposase
MLPIVKFPNVVENALPKFEPIFNKAQLRHFGEYLTGLMVSENKTVSGINSHFIDHTDQSAKNHFLTEAEWSEEALTQTRMEILLEHCRKEGIQDGILVIDDTLGEKEGQSIEGANWFWDHSEKHYTFGHPLVTSEYVTRSFHVPLHYRLYLKEEDVPSGAFKSKLDLAIELFQEAEKAGIRFSCAIGDSWYFCDSIIKYLEAVKKHWVFASKSNRKIMANNRWIQLKEFVNLLKKEDFKKVTVKKHSGKEITTWAFSKTLRMHKVGRVKVVISYLEEPFKGNPFFLVTDQKEWTIERILSVYAKRWPIETFYRDAKQHLGLEDCELRLLKGIRRHWDLVFLTYTLLTLESSTGPLTKWIKSNVVTIGGKTRLAYSEILRSFIFWANQFFNQDKDVDYIFEMAMKGNPQLKFQF